MCPGSLQCDPTCPGTKDSPIYISAMPAPALPFYFSVSCAHETQRGGPSLGARGKTLGQEMANQVPLWGGG